MPSYIVVHLAKSILSSHRYTVGPVPALVIQGVGPLKFLAKVSALAMHKARIILYSPENSSCSRFFLLHSLGAVLGSTEYLSVVHSFVGGWFNLTRFFTLIFHAPVALKFSNLPCNRDPHCPQRKLRRTSDPPSNVSSN